MYSFPWFELLRSVLAALELLLCRFHRPLSDNVFKTHRALMTVLVTALALGGASPVQAQMCAYGDPSYDCQIQRHGTLGDQAEIWRREQQQSNQAEAQRQWQIRENAVQASIAKERATPAYGALAISEKDSSVGGGLGYTTKETAIQHALKSCETVGNCRVLVTFFNTCAGVASLIDTKDPRAIVVATDPNPRTALDKAYRQCEAKYGKDTCGVRNNAKAYCAGYDYGLYGVK